MKGGLFYMEKDQKQTVIAYIDGFNFYFGLKEKRWKNFYWLDICKFIERNLRPYQELLEVNYFTAIPLDKDKADRQDKLFQANKMNKKFKLHLGKYLKKDKRCYNCGYINHTYEEKETDVRIATSILYDSFKNKSDIIILVSADSDLIPPIEIIKEINPKQKILIFFPPNRFSYDLKNISNASKSLNHSYSVFAECVLPEEITLPDGYLLERPSSWK